MRGIAVSPLIYFHGGYSELRQRRRHRIWLETCWRCFASGRVLKSVHYYFVSRETIVDLHARFLAEEVPTDILTFDYGESAEIFISPVVVRMNASLYGVSFSEELRRVLVHGLLHLLGLDDHTESQCAAMRAAEEFCLKEWQKIVSHETQRQRL
ncbi:MAG: rRNA maturation RNase YbeY [Bacteroidia bacterium]|nr:rRNA maturation RNase YbeY [Bacteroidia bacterium]MDW8014553.1 rRNA maturation RNase YbeY [Bacteroidia bacterium]